MAAAGDGMVEEFLIFSFGFLILDQFDIFEAWQQFKGCILSAANNFCKPNYRNYQKIVKRASLCEWLAYFMSLISLIIRIIGKSHKLWPLQQFRQILI